MGSGQWSDPGRERLTPLSAFAFGGCKGAKAPCRKGVLATANAPLSLAGAEDKKRIAGKDQRTSRNTRAAPEKGDRNTGSTPCKAFHFALRFGKIGEELENYEIFAGLFLGYETGVPYLPASAPGKARRFNFVRFPERILPVRSSPVQPFLLTAAEVF